MVEFKVMLANVPLESGVPVRIPQNTPVLALKSRPAGKVPVIDQVGGKATWVTAEV